MTKGWDEVGGRDDVYLANELPDLSRWRIDELPLLEADELTDEGEFPYHGDFALATLIDDDREVYIQVTEGLRDFIDELRGEEPVIQVGVEVDTAVKEGGEETSRWRFTGDVSPLGPPSDGAA